MTAIELYKRLPKTNCGKCPPGQCMAFAIGVIKGDSRIGECPLLSEQELSDLRGSITLKDWREDLIKKLQEEIRTLDLAGIAGGIGAAMQGNSLSLTCMGRPFTVSPEGEIGTHGPVTPWVKILILHYIRMQGREAIAGKWTSYGDLKSGMVKASSFLRDCEEPLRELFDRDLEATTQALRRMGAVSAEEFPTAYAWRLTLLPKVPVALLYWPCDEEFPSKVKVLFDTSADKFLDVETLLFLVEGLAKNIERLSGQPK